ncbi:hypothetical protein A2160_03800 [Candidatus Beckwithbacteria bacterium RBG_13_42_9]|uniref:Uncharacterized protein n=1 Tax=Candidatus Beckwithbacteria bacterium RBG_13_42_9 TaxID=1797457 RepID=A0A1F5E4V2_9BACT|nr:MAG: hypothetical protein A2160_03800 [Candidatus Beckwithbacteria bacterium RBG_13_42_9]
MSDVLIDADFISEEAVEQGLTPSVIRYLGDQGYRYGSMVCPNMFEQAEYRQGLKGREIKEIPLMGGGAAFFIKVGL